MVTFLLLFFLSFSLSLFLSFSLSLSISRKIHAEVLHPKKGLKKEREIDLDFWRCFGWLLLREISKVGFKNWIGWMGFDYYSNNIMSLTPLMLHSNLLTQSEFDPSSTRSEENNLIRIWRKSYPTPTPNLRSESELDTDRSWTLLKIRHSDLTPTLKEIQLWIWVLPQYFIFFKTLEVINSSFLSY